MRISQMLHEVKKEELTKGGENLKKHKNEKVNRKKEEKQKIKEKEKLFVRENNYLKIYINI